MVRDGIMRDYIVPAEGEENMYWDRIAIIVGEVDLRPRGSRKTVNDKEEEDDDDDDHHHKTPRSRRKKKVVIKDDTPSPPKAEGR
jgi:hypothetical protein